MVVLKIGELVCKIRKFSVTNMKSFFSPRLAALLLYNSVLEINQTLVLTLDDKSVLLLITDQERMSFWREPDFCVICEHVVNFGQNINHKCVEIEN